MNTTEEKVITSVTVNASQFRDLIAGALTHASKDKSLPRLNGIYLGREEGKVIAVATDRYRLIEGTIESEGEGESKPVRLAYDDAKSLASSLAKIKRGKVSITMAGDLLTVGVDHSMTTYTTHLDELPPYRHLMEISRDPVAFPYLSLNPSFFADYGKICGKKAQVIVRQYGGDKPYHVEILDTNVSWRALLMPMKVSN